MGPIRTHKPLFYLVGPTNTRSTATRRTNKNLSNIFQKKKRNDDRGRKPESDGYVTSEFLEGSVDDFKRRGAAKALGQFLVILLQHFPFLLAHRTSLCNQSIKITRENGQLHTPCHKITGQREIFFLGAWRRNCRKQKIWLEGSSSFGAYQYQEQTSMRPKGRPSRLVSAAQKSAWPNLAFLCIDPTAEIRWN